MFYDLLSKENCESSSFWKKNLVKLLILKVLILVHGNILILFNRKKSLAGKQGSGTCFDWFH